MNIPCNVVNDLLPLYHDGVCSPETAVLIEEHLRGCEGCREEYHKLQAAPQPAVSSAREAKRALELKKIRRVMRRKRIAIAAVAVALAIAFSVALGFFLANFTIVPSASEVIRSVTVEEGMLTVTMEGFFRDSPMTACIPATAPSQGAETEVASGEPILLIVSSYTPLDALDSWLHGNAVSTVWQVGYTLTQSAWENSFGKEVEWLKQDAQTRGYEAEELLANLSDAHVLPWGDIEKVYYFSSRNTHDITQEALAQYGTLLWTAEDGVVYSQDGTANEP